MKITITSKGIEAEIDFSDQIKQTAADEKAGYPPNCNKGYEAKDGKCVKIAEDEAKDKDKDKDKKDSSDKKKGDSEKNGGEKGGKKLPPWLKKKK